MIELSFTLHAGDGEILDETVQSDQVPRVGDLVSFDWNCSFLVVDVL